MKLLGYILLVAVLMVLSLWLTKLVWTSNLPDWLKIWLVVAK